MTFGSGKSVDALRWLACNPHIRVVHNLWDPLDVLVSRYKHKNKGVVAHCALGGAACLKSHRNARPMLPTEGGWLMRLIGEVAEESDRVGRLLGELRAVEWWRVFSFLGVG